MIDLSQISVSFGGIPALRDLSLSVDQGVVLGIVGPGGCGKTTLCKVVAGLQSPDEGEVWVDGISFHNATRKDIQQVQKKIGVQFQNDALFEHMSVLENVCYPLLRLALDSSGSVMSSADIQAVAADYLGMVGLSDFTTVFPNRLSGGQRRRVALARACASTPRILICDDPTAGLDPQTSRQILDLIATMAHHQKSTVLVVSSDIVGLFTISTRIALLWEGRLLEEGNTRHIQDSTASEVVRFLDDARLPFSGWSWE